MKLEKQLLIDYYSNIMSKPDYEYKYISKEKFNNECTCLVYSIKHVFVFPNQYKYLYVHYSDNQYARYFCVLDKLNDNVYQEWPDVINYYCEYNDNIKYEQYYTDKIRTYKYLLKTRQFVHNISHLKLNDEIKNKIEAYKLMNKIANRKIAISIEEYSSSIIGHLFDIWAKSLSPFTKSV